MRGHIASFQKNILRKKAKQKAKNSDFGETKSLSRRGSGGKNKLFLRVIKACDANQLFAVFVNIINTVD